MLCGGAINDINNSLHPFITQSINGQPVAVAIGPQDSSLAVVAATKGTVVVKDGKVAFQTKEPMWTAQCISLSSDQSTVRTVARVRVPIVGRLPPLTLLCSHDDGLSVG